jgi:hypothetical protein
MSEAGVEAHENTRKHTKLHIHLSFLLPSVAPHRHCLTGPLHTQSEALATTLARRFPSFHDLLHALSASPDANGGQARGKSPGVGGPGAGMGSIRRFCGISDVQRAALLLLRAALRSSCGAVCWQLGRVLEALNTLVEAGGPSFASQPDLLVKITQIYVEAEDQLAVALTQQAGADPRGVTSGALPAPARPPPPPAICAVLQRTAQLSECLPPGHPVAAWLLARAVTSPAVVQRLLGAWLAACAPLGLSREEHELTNEDEAAQQRTQEVAAALADAPGALPLLSHAAASWERRLQEVPAQRGGSGAAGCASAGAVAAAVHLAVLTRALKFNPSLTGSTLLADAQLAQVLRRHLLENGGRPDGESCAVFAGCCGVLMGLACVCGGVTAVTVLVEAAAPLVRLNVGQGSGLVFQSRFDTCLLVHHQQKPAWMLPHHRM